LPRANFYQSCSTAAGMAKLRPPGRICPAKHRADFFQALRFRLWTAVQKHWLMPVSCFTCLPQQHLPASIAIEM